MSDTRNSAGSLLDQMLSDQLSEDEAKDLYTVAFAEYENAKSSDVEITSSSPLFTPRTWWLLP